MKYVMLFLLIFLLTSCSMYEENENSQRFTEACILICEAPYKKFEKDTLERYFEGLALNEVLQNYMPIVDYENNLITYNGNINSKPAMKILSSNKTEYGEYDYIIAVSFEDIAQVISIKTKGDKIVKYEVTLQDEW